jgi:purine-binding chemotaxis protein CheW
MTEPEGNAEQVLLLELAGALYAVDSAAVREVIPTAPATRLPGAPGHVRGIMNLRGQLLTVVDLVQRLTGAATCNPEGSTIVVQSGGRMLGLSVDDVRQVHAVTVSGAGGLSIDFPGLGLVRGLGRFGDEVVIVLDVDEIVRQTLA